MPETKTAPDPNRLCERCKHPWKLHYHDGPQCFDGAAFPCCECPGFVEPGQPIPPPPTLGQILAQGLHQAIGIFARYFEEETKARSRKRATRATRQKPKMAGKKRKKGAPR